MEDNRTLGKKLQKARNTQKLSIEDIANKTRININVLRSIESGDYDKLPSKAYLKGFVKTFAKTLKLDIDEISILFEQEYERETSPKPQTQEKSSIATPPKAPRQVEEVEKEQEREEVREQFISTISQFINKKVLLSIAGIFLIIVIIKSAVSFFGQIAKEGNQDLSPTKTNTSSSKLEVVQANEILKPVEANILEMEASKRYAKELLEKKKVAEAKKIEEEKEEERKKVAEAKKKKEEEKEKVAIKKEEKKKKIQQSLKDGELPYIQFYSAPKKIYEIVENSEEEKNSDLLPSNVKASIISGKQNIYIKATKGDTWISYQADEDDIKRFVLKQGRWVLIKGDTVLLFMGNLNAATIFHNNKLVRAKSRTGVKSFIFPQSLAENYQYPLFPSYKGVPYKASVYKERMAEKPTETN